MKKTLLALAASLPLLGLGSAASAVTATGTFQIDIYNFDAGGVSGNADATAANIIGKTLLDSIVYTGELSFSTVKGTPVTNPDGRPSIADWLATGNGILSGVDADLSAYTLSEGAGSNGGLSGNFRTTTFFDIRGAGANSVVGSIFHDDGISFYDNGVLETPGSHADPTTLQETVFDFGGGDFRLIYAAANGDPSILRVDLRQGRLYDEPEPVPLPATAVLLLAAVGGLGVARKRRA